MFWLMIFLIALLALAYRRAGIRSSAIVLGGVVLAYGLLGHSLGLFVLLALIWAAAFLPLSVPALRQEWLSRPALNAFRRGLQGVPADTASLLETGDAGCDAQLFGGAPDWLALRQLRAPTLSATDQRLLDEIIDPACSALARNAGDQDARKRFVGAVLGADPVSVPPDVEHADGHTVQPDPVQRDARSIVRSIACARMAAAAGTAAWPLVAPSRAGWIQLLRDEIRDGRTRDWLARAESDHSVLAIAGSGLDPERQSCAWAGIARAPQSDDVDDDSSEPGLRLSLLPGVRAEHAAEHYAMLVEFPRKADTPADKPSGGSACVVVPADAPGLCVTTAADGSVALAGEAVFAPLSALVGGARRIGLGAQKLSCAMTEALAVNAPALRLGGILPLALAGGARARLHDPFLQPATAHGAIRGLLADNAADLFAANALREMTLASLGSGTAPTTLAAIANLQTAALAARIAGRRLGYGGALAQLDARHVPAPVSVLSSVQLGLRALSRCHPHLRRELDAARATPSAEALEHFDEAFWAHIGHVQSNAVRSLMGALGAGTLLPSAGLAPSVARCQRRIDRASANLALLVDLALFSLRGRALRKDALLASIGNALAVLQRASAVLWKAQAADGSSDALPLLRLAAAEALETVQECFDDIIRELPRSPLRGLARVLVFPFGRWRLAWREGDHDAAARWLSEGAATRQFAALMPASLPEPALQLRRTLEATLAGEPLASRLEGSDDASGHALSRIDAAEQAGHLDATQARQLRDWLELCSSIEAPPARDA